MLTRGYLKGFLAMVAVGVLMQTSLAASGDCHHKSKSHNKYVAGVKTIFIHEDPEIQGFDTVGGITEGIRVLPADIWYPVDANAKHLTHAKYSEYFFGNLSAFQQYEAAVGITLANTDAIKAGTTQAQYDAAVLKRFNSNRDAFRDAPIAKGSFPIILMMHNNAAHRTAFNIIGEILARAGYIAIAWDVTGNSNMAQVAEDPNYPAVNVGLVPINPNFNSYDQSANVGNLLGGFLFAPPEIAAEQGQLIFTAFEEQRLDHIAIISQLPDFNNGTDPYTNGFFAGKIDLNQIGLTSQSLGSIVGRIVLGTVEEVKVGFFNVPVSDADYSHRFLDITAVTGVDYINPLRETNPSFSWIYDHVSTPESKPAYYLLGAEDGVTQFFNGFLANPGHMDVPPTEETPAPDVRRAFEYSTGPAFLAEITRVFHDFFNFSQSPAGLFPEIANLVHTQIWHPPLTYVELSQDKGYRVLKSKLVSFLNVYLRHKDSYLKELLSNEFRKYIIQFNHFPGSNDSNMTEQQEQSVNSPLITGITEASKVAVKN